MDDLPKKFQPPGAGWEERAAKEGLRAVLDPDDQRGMKNQYIDMLHKAALAKHLKTRRGEKILDFGCGTGRLFGFLSKYGAQVTGIDITKNMTDAAAKLYPGGTFIHYDGGKLPFENDFFDDIVSVYVLQHITARENLEATAKELMRCLKKGSRIYLIEQVSKESSDYYLHRLPQDYQEAFSGCRCVHSSPVRNCRSPFLSLAYRGLLPRFAFPVLVRLDLFFTGKKKIPAKGYLDYLFVFQK
jgi:ubiquinone/menaquinone biosynthesis C-methylase UbiE